MNFAAIAQQVERILGKDEVPSSNLGSSSKKRDTRLSVSFFVFCRNHITKPKPSAAGLAWRGKRKEHSGTFARRVKEERCEFLLTRGSSSKKLLHHQV